MERLRRPALGLCSGIRLKHSRRESTGRRVIAAPHMWGGGVCVREGWKGAGRQVFFRNIHLTLNHHVTWELQICHNQNFYLIISVQNPLIVS
jgi:hypothetical protein